MFLTAASFIRLPRKPINFYPIYEFDSDKKDFSVAAKAVEILEADIAKGFPHLLLVRASTQNRARELYEFIYEPNFSKHNPVLIISGNSASDNKEALQKVNDGNAKIIICVDMFSEGIDIPQLKICAIHEMISTTLNARQTLMIAFIRCMIR